VRRLRAPALRAAAWCGFVLVVAAVLYALLDGADRTAGFTNNAYVLPSLIGAILTAILAAVAAFQLSLPDRSPQWVWLPLPGLVLWAGFAGLGCLANLGEATTWGSSWVEVRECLTIIIGVSVPVSILMVVMLRRALPLAPTATALMGGLASAAAAGSVLIVVHPHNSTLLDLGVHVVCVAAVIGANALVGGRLLQAKNRPPGR
jgi:hypothetical protein